MSKKENGEMLDNNFLKQTVILLEEISTKERIPKALEETLVEKIQQLNEQVNELNKYNIQLVQDTDHIKYVGRSKSTIGLTKGNLYAIVDENDTEYLVLTENRSIAPVPKAETELINMLCIKGLNAIEYLVANPYAKLYNSTGDILEFSGDRSLLVKILDKDKSTVNLTLDLDFYQSIWYLEPVNEHKGLNGFMKLLNIFHIK